MRFLDELAAASPQIFVVQIGSNDGVSGDPLHPYIKRFGWQGVLVEPLPHLCRELIETYAGIPGITCENAAIGEQSGIHDFFISATQPIPCRPGIARSALSTATTS